MTDKNRQKGNESVGEKSDGLAHYIEAREALRKGADESREVFDGWYHAQIRNGKSPQDIAFNIHCANASNVRELAAYRYAALARPAPEALGAWKCGAQDAPAFSEPTDCNWPECGCDPHVERIVAGLQECGWTVEKGSTYEREALGAAKGVAVEECLEALRDVIGWVPSRRFFHTNEAQNAVERARAILAKAKDQS